MKAPVVAVFFVCAATAATFALQCFFVQIPSSHHEPEVQIQHRLRLRLCYKGGCSSLRHTCPEGTLSYPVTPESSVADCHEEGVHQQGHGQGGIRAEPAAEEQGDGGEAGGGAL